MVNNQLDDKQNKIMTYSGDKAMWKNSADQPAHIATFKAKSNPATYPA